MADIQLTEDEFLSILRANAGLFARTARAITETYGINYSRQAVRDRALNYKDVLEEIQEEGLDTAEFGMRELLVDPDKEIKFKSCKYVLGTLGKKRGYVERTEVNQVDTEGNSIQPVINITVVQPKTPDSSSPIAE